MLFDIITFHFYILGLNLGDLMIILVEIKVKGVLFEMRKKAPMYGQDHRAEQLPINDRYWIL